MKYNEANNRLSETILALLQFEVLDQQEENKEKPDLLRALSKLPKNGIILGNYFIDEQIYYKFNDLAYGSKVGLPRLYSLAIAEFIEKYEQCILELKDLLDE